MAESETNEFSYLPMFYKVPMIAASASWTSLEGGIPWGGTLSAILMVIMSNDSGQTPFAPLVAAITALPVAIICDTLFYIPCQVIRALKLEKKIED
jgi:hypothetical protein